MFKPMTKKETKEFIISRAGIPEHFYLLRDLEASKRNNIPFIQDISIELFKLFLDKTIHVRISDILWEDCKYDRKFNPNLNYIPYQTKKDYARQQSIICYRVNDAFKSVENLYDIFLDSLELAWLCIPPLPAEYDTYTRQAMTYGYGKKLNRYHSLKWILRDNIYLYLNESKNEPSRYTDMWVIENMIEGLEPLIKYLEFLEQNGIEKHDDNAIELYELNKIM